MIIVEVDVPMMGKCYDFQMDENINLCEIKEEITELICQKEQCSMVEDKKCLMLWNIQRGMPVEESHTPWEEGLLTGSRLMLF